MATIEPRIKRLERIRANGQQGETRLLLIGPGQAEPEGLGQGVIVVRSRIPDPAPLPPELERAG